MKTLKQLRESILEQEAVTKTGPSKADIEKSIAGLHDSHAKLNAYEEKLKAGPKGEYDLRKGSIERARTTYNHAIEFHKILPKVNELKSKMDKAHKAGDADEFDKHHSEFKNLMGDFKLTDKSRDVNKNTKYKFKFGSDTSNDGKSHQQQTIDKFDYLKRLRDSKAGEELRKTPEQKAASAKRSAAMRARWSE